MNYDITMCANINCKKRLECLRYVSFKAYRADKNSKPPYVSMAYVPDTEKCDLFVKLYKR